MISRQIYTTKSKLLIRALISDQASFVWIPSPHILSKQQVNACILTEGPNKVKLNFNYTNRQNKELYKQFSLILYDIVCKIDHGILVVFPSYSLLEKAKVELSENGYLGKIYAKKSVFFENKNSVDFNLVLKSYLFEAQKVKGAIMFALAKGKVSEGLDFSHDKCRGLVMAGVPYPAAKDPKVLSKMEYLNRKSQITKTMNGNEWYICETVRCINQSIGRIIRNKEDYGSIYLLDERFRKSEILGQISTWAKQCIKVINNYDDFVFKMDLFEEHHKKSARETYQSNDKPFESASGIRLNPDGTVSKAPHLDPVAMNYAQNLRNIVKKPGSSSKPVDPEKEHHTIQQKFAGEIQAIESKVNRDKINREKIIFSKKFVKKTVEVVLKQCPVCRIDKKLIKNSECIHEICLDCWDIWLKKDLRCPICRIRVREKYLQL